MWFNLGRELHPKPVVLLILDGWGDAPPWGGNAISIAHTPSLTELYRTAYHTTLQASGAAVGLPGHEQGNSEVGHLTIGAGRAVVQDRTRISQAIEDGSFFRNPVLLAAMERSRVPGRTLHLVGLASSGGVHSHLDHLHALLELAAKTGVTQVAIHAITDGRDVLAHTAAQELDRVRHWCTELGVGAIVSIVGRSFAMDRDNHWNRIEPAYRLFTEGQGAKATSVLAAISQQYAQGLTDEFLEPTWIDGGPGPIRSGDSVVFYNFRQDRARQLLSAFADARFEHFQRPALTDLFVVSMIPYWVDTDQPNVHVAFTPDVRGATLGQSLSDAGLRQLRIAETEKYAHVTYFLNGGHETPYPGEDRQLIPSKLTEAPNHAPAMKTLDIARAVVHALRGRQHHAIVANVASPDMVGHTGDLQATARACEVVDQAIGMILSATKQAGGTFLITADHGNAEQLVNPVTNEPDTHHTTHPVPFVLVSSVPGVRGMSRSDQTLSDVAPTVLTLLGVPVPPTMTGQSLGTIESTQPRA